jgi:CAAX amino terminal protease family.
MKKIKSLMPQYPLLVALVILIGVVVITEATEIPLYSSFTHGFDMQTSYYLAEIIEQSVFAVLLAVLIARAGILRNAGLLKPKKSRELWIVWPILILTAINGWSLFDGSMSVDTSKPHILLLFVLIALSTGFYEEILCRGLILTACLKKWGKTKKGLYLAVIVSSVIFGLFHFANLIMGRGTLLQVATQLCYSTFFGVFFSACFLRFSSLWPAIITHTLFDMMGTLHEISVGNVFVDHFMDTNTSISNALLTISVTLPLFIYGLFILRRVTPESMNESALFPNTQDKNVIGPKMSCEVNQ